LSKSGEQRINTLEIIRILFAENIFTTIFIAYDLPKTLSGHGYLVYIVAFDNNDMLANGSDDKTIKLWNKNTGDPLRTLSGHGSYVLNVAFDNNDILASFSSDFTIKL
jgi:WD40 repeat protein